MDDKNRVDLPCFLLFEATGDNSEVFDSSKNTTFGPEDDSDAMSCSYESENLAVHDIDDDLTAGFVDQDSRFEEKGDNKLYNVECLREDEDEDEECGVVDQELKKCDEQKKVQPNKVDERAAKKKVVCVESCEELMRRREEDKLFWKSCLES